MFTGLFIEKNCRRASEVLKSVGRIKQGGSY